MAWPYARVVCLLAASLLLAAGALLGVAGGAIASASLDANVATAQADVVRLHGLLRLPPGAEAVAGDPTGERAALAYPTWRTTAQNVVEQTSWWIVPGSPDEIVDWTNAHPPDHSHVFGSSGGGAGHTPADRVIAFGWRAIWNVIDNRMLAIHAVELDRRTSGVRVDTRASWLIPRPAGERIPPRAQLVRIAPYGFGSDGLGPFTVTDPGRLWRVAALIDRLIPPQPTGVGSCFGGGPGLRMTFRSSAGGRALAHVDVPPGGCSIARLSIYGHRRGLLSAKGVAFAVGCATGVNVFRDEFFFRNDDGKAFERACSRPGLR